MKLIEYPDREALVLQLAQDIAGRLRQALRSDGRATLCLPGGSTPAPLFSQLSELQLEWDRVIVFPGDERCVPPADARSNARLVRHQLMQGPAAAAQFIDLFTGTGTPEEEAAAATERLAPALPITVLLLGMGEDMHVASLFPDNDGTAAALDAGAPPVVAIRSEALAEARLTLSGPALKTAMDPHLMIFGAAKRAALERAAKLPPAQAPVRALWGDLNVHWAE